MLRNSTFDPEEIDREKGVIVEEMNMYFDTPRDFIGGIYEELLYGDQPLGWHIIGRKETVRAATRDTFQGYLDRWYQPERMVVGLGGKIGDDLLPTLERLLGDIPAQSTTARSRSRRRTGRPAHACESITRSPTRRTSSSACRACRSATPTATR